MCVCVHVILYPFCVYNTGSTLQFFHSFLYKETPILNVLATPYLTVHIPHQNKIPLAEQLG